MYTAFATHTLSPLEPRAKASIEYVGITNILFRGIAVEHSCVRDAAAANGMQWESEALLSEIQSQTTSVLRTYRAFTQESRPIWIFYKNTALLLGIKFIVVIHFDKKTRRILKYKD